MIAAMRSLRSAFVFTFTAATAACASNPTTPPVQEPHRNPPAQPDPTPIAPPRNPPAPVCPPRAEIRAGAPCPVEGLECHLPTGGCQPGGWVCERGAWRETPMPTCNPPAPPR